MARLMLLPRTFRFFLACGAFIHRAGHFLLQMLFYVHVGKSRQSWGCLGSFIVSYVYMGSDTGSCQIQIIGFSIYSISIGLVWRCRGLGLVENAKDCTAKADSHGTMISGMAVGWDMGHAGVNRINGQRVRFVLLSLKFRIRRVLRVLLSRS